MQDFLDNDDDVFTGKEHTPLRADAFDKLPAEKIEIIQHHFGKIMETLGLDMTDDSLKDSPRRVARMYVTRK
jgi:GTP cyclohydrolase I